MEPILIVSQPRSGSSMTAGLFHHHGVWTGTCRPGDATNAKGHFESIPIRTALIGMHKAIVHDGKLAKPVPGFRDKVLALIRADGYRDGPWLWKGSVMYWPAWYEFQPKWVCVYRPREAIFESCRKSRMFGAKFNDAELYANIDFHQQQMQFLHDQHDAPWVNSDEVAHGDYSSLRAAIEYCGLPFSVEICERFVDRSLWHYSPSAPAGDPNTASNTAAL